MRVFVLALVALFLAAGYLLPEFVTGLPPDYDFYRNVALMLTSLALLAVGIHDWRRRSQMLRLSDKQQQAEAEFAERAAKARADEARRLSALAEERDELRRALDDTTERLRQAAAEHKAQASQSVDAGVLNFLSVLQQKGRFIDFVMDDITKYPDPQVGAAARVVHQGCSQVLKEYFDIRPIHSEREGVQLLLDKNFDARRYRLLGKVQGEPPFRGRLLHKGWLTTSIKLPEAIERQATGKGQEGVIAPAEVELH